MPRALKWISTSFVFPAFRPAIADKPTGSALWRAVVGRECHAAQQQSLSANNENRQFPPLVNCLIAIARFPI